MKVHILQKGEYQSQKLRMTQTLAEEPTVAQDNSKVSQISSGHANDSKLLYGIWRPDLPHLKS